MKLRSGLLLASAAILFGVNTFAMTVWQDSLRLATIKRANRKVLLVQLNDLAGSAKSDALATLALPITEKYSVEPMLTHPLKNFSVLEQRSLGRYVYMIFNHSLSATDAAMVLQYMSSLPAVTQAFFEPTVSDPIAYPIIVPKSQLRTAPKVSGPAPNFEEKQQYLQPAPVGVDAQYAWTLPGGHGEGVNVIDIETGWYQEHNDFRKTFFENGKNARRDHGTAVWGIIASKNDGVGTTGIADKVEYGTCGTGYAGGGTDEYIRLLTRATVDAADHARPGDVVVMEQHMAGPDQGNYSPVEYFPPVFEVLKAITDRGVFCVAAAGNGNSNLDSAEYAGAFDETVRDSGCILVGAGGSPVGNSPRHRMYFSNYGKRVDAFGPGELVTSTGYGDLFGNGDTTSNYTAQFNGTSSATPVVSGVVAVLSGMAKAKNVIITPIQMRAAIRATGTPQDGGKTENIGSLPDLKVLTAKLFESVK